MSRQDEVEEQYELLLKMAMQNGDNNWAHELWIGLQQYRTMFK